MQIDHWKIWYSKWGKYYLLTGAIFTEVVIVDNKKTVAEQINYNVPTSVNKQWVKIRAVGKEDESDIPVIEMWINPCG